MYSKNHSWYRWLALVAVCFASAVQALEIPPTEVDEDLLAADQVEFFAYDSDNESNGSMEFKGNGTLTITKSPTDYPRYTIIGGTAIEITFPGTSINYWEGTLSAVGEMIKPADYLLQPLEENYTLESAAAFGWGSIYDLVTFSVPAYFTFKLGSSDAKDGQVLSVVEGENYLESDQTCTVKNSLCTIQLTKLDTVTLAARRYERCPIYLSPDVGEVNTPYCIPECNEGYILNDEADNCRVRTEDDPLDLQAASRADEVGALRDVPIYHGTPRPNVRAEPERVVDNSEDEALRQALLKDSYLAYQQANRLAFEAEQQATAAQVELPESDAEATVASGQWELPRSGSGWWWLGLIFAGSVVLCFGLQRSR